VVEGLVALQLAEMIGDSPAAGFLAKSDLSLHGINQILTHAK